MLSFSTMESIWKVGNIRSLSLCCFGENNIFYSTILRAHINKLNTKSENVLLFPQKITEYVARIGAYLMANT